MSAVTPAKAQNTNSQTFLTALVTNAAVLGVELAAFVFLKHRLSRIYEPRTYLPPPDKRAVNLPSGWWKWLLAIGAIPTGDVLQKNGMDAYMFLRFLRLLFILFASITFLSCSILIPVDAVKVGNTGITDILTKLSWTNIPADDKGRYAAHLVVAWLSTFWTLFLIRRELKHYARTRQQFLISPAHASLAQARTVLVTNVPAEMCTEHDLRRWASFVPGGVQNVWVYRDTKELNDAYKARLKLCKKLEKAASKLIRTVVKAKHKHDKSEEKQYNKTHKAEAKQHRREDTALAQRRAEGAAESRRAEEEYARAHGMHALADVGRASADTAATAVGSENGNGKGRASLDGHAAARPRGARTTTGELEAGRLPPSPALSDARSDGDDEALRLIDAYVPQKKRPTHRLGFLGLFGRKVDTLDYCKEEIARLNREIDEKRGVLMNAKTAPRPLGSAFIQCNLQMGAHVLAQCVSYHEPLAMADKYIEVSPKDIIWDNIDDGAYEMRFRYITSWMGSIALILIWFAPVAFVGTLSNVATLCEKVSWLCWIRDAPTPVPGIIQGILPPVFLAILFAILPWLLKGLAWYEDIPRYTLLSISVYKRYFLFLVIHGFLVVTLSSGFTTAASAIVENPTSGVTELAKQLPNASIFFLTWTLTQGLSGAGSALLQVGQLLGHFIKKWLLGRTPRQAYAVTFMMPKADFGLILPRMSLLATIGLAYSALSPIINPLAAVSFLLFFFSWKFLLTWVFDQPDETETGGQYFPLAINFIFVGLYIEQVCLAVLFFLKISDSVLFVVEGVLMIVLIALTLLAQILFRRSFLPITRFLPMSLATKKMQERVERERKRHHIEQNEADDADMDLFSAERIRSVVHHQIRNPIKKLAQEVQKNVAKTANIEPNLKTDDLDIEHPIKDDKPSASTSAHAVSGTAVNEQLQRPATQRNRSSRHPHLPTAANGEKRDVDTFPDLAPPARRDGTGTDDAEDPEAEKDFDVHGFDHPSTYAPQPWVWIPRDPLGLSRVFVDELVGSGVQASDEGATMDPKGTVEVYRSPPDEDWSGGHDA